MAKNQRLVNEVAWAASRVLFILKHWTIPLNPTSGAKSISVRDGVSARAFALLVIVALTFAIRADLNSTVAKISYAGIAATVAALLSVCLNLISKNINVKFHERAVISSYASTIGVMLLFIAGEVFLRGVDWYEEIGQIIGSTIVSIILAVAMTYLLLFAKAKFIDRNKISLRAGLAGAAVVVGSGLIVLIISLMTNDLFRFAVCAFQSGKCSF